MNYALYGLVLIHILGVLFQISEIGKPREPLTPGVVALSTFIVGIQIAIIFAAATQL